MFIVPLWFWFAVWIETISITGFDLRPYFHKHSPLQQFGLSKRIYSDSFACLDLAFNFHDVSPSTFCISFQTLVELHTKNRISFTVMQHTTAMDHLY